MESETFADGLKFLFRPLCLVTIVILYLVAERLRQYWRLRQFKGPATTGFSWLWHSKAVLGGQCHRHYGDVIEKYGPIARITPNHLITSSPELWAHVNAVRSPYARSPWYYHCARFAPGKDNIFTECDNHKHDERRKKMVAGYAGKENPNLETDIDTHVRELLDLIGSKYAIPTTSNVLSKPMDLARKIQFLTLDVISHVALGTPFGDLKADADVNDYLKSSGEGLDISNSSWGLGTSWIVDIPILGKALMPSDRDERGFGNMMGQARKCIEERMLKSTDERSDMLSSFIRHGVKGDDLFHETFEQILAGSDTTAASIRIIMLYLMSDPRVYNKLRAEVDEAVETGVAPLPPEIIPDTKARQLPYLAAVIREGMRVHPPVVNLFSRIVPKGGDRVTVDGEQYFLPGGSLIGYSAWSMHRNNKSLYGADAHVFRPERWFVPEDEPYGKERLQRMLKTNDLLFGYGRWVCLGRTVAMIEVHKTIFELVRNFDLALVNPHEPWKIHNSMGLFDIGDMWVHVTKRS